MREMRQAVAFFSLQHPTEQIVQRMISIVGRFPVHDLREGVHTEDWPRLVRSVAEVSRAPLFVSDSASTTPAAMRSTLEDLSGDLRGTDMRLGMVVVDHLGLMLPPVGSVPNREERVSDVLRELKVLARNLDIPVLLLVQLPRLRGQRHDKRPLLSDFEPTEPVEDFADMVMFLYRDELYNPDSDDKGIAEVIVAKHRSGPTGKVLLAYLESFGKFASLARR